MTADNTERLRKVRDSIAAQLDAIDARRSAGKVTKLDDDTYQRLAALLLRYEAAVAGASQGDGGLPSMKPGTADETT